MTDASGTYCGTCNEMIPQAKPSYVRFCKLGLDCGLLKVEPSSPPRDPLLTERQKTHGSFQMNAIASQKLKTILQSDSFGYGEMKVEHREALDMIALKLSRILSGQAGFKDHWDDIAGYAKLASEACEK